MLHHQDISTDHGARISKFVRPAGLMPLQGLRFH